MFKHKRSYEDIADAFVRVNGNLDALDHHLRNNKVHYGPYAQRMAIEIAKDRKFYSEWN